MISLITIKHHLICNIMNIQQQLKWSFDWSPCRISPSPNRAGLLKPMRSTLSQWGPIKHLLWDGSKLPFTRHSYLFEKYTPMQIQFWKGFFFFNRCHLFRTWALASTTNTWIFNLVRYTCRPNVTTFWDFLAKNLSLQGFLQFDPFWHKTLEKQHFFGLH